MNVTRQLEHYIRLLLIALHFYGTNCKIIFIERNSTIFSTWMKPETPARIRVEFWQWRDARFPWTSSTLSGNLHLEIQCGDVVCVWVLFPSEWSTCCVLSPVPDYVKATVETVVKIHEADEDGDVLAFLTGQVSGLLLGSALSRLPLDRMLLCQCSFLIWRSSFAIRTKWRKWCPFCRNRPGLCQNMAWRNTSEFCPCTRACLTLTRWRSLRGSPPLFAR